MAELLPALRRAYWPLVAIGALYLACIGLLVHPAIQQNAVYLHRLKITWGLDLTKPEQFGFAKNQVTPFYLDTPDGERVFAWHVLPLGLYMEHRDSLVQQEDGVKDAPLSTENLRLLTSDPEARLIIHFHGNAGTMGAGFRPSYMRSLSAAHPSKLHILAIDYRGFGLSTGAPSEAGLITDGLAAVRFAMSRLGVSPGRIALVGQSLGTAVTFGVAEALATGRGPSGGESGKHAGVELGAVVSIAGFSSLKKLVTTYRVWGVLPVLRPLRAYPRLQTWLTGFVYESWDSAGRVASLVRASRKLNLLLIHALDDMDIPWAHVDELFLAAASATQNATQNATQQQQQDPHPYSTPHELSAAEVQAARVETSFGDESTRFRWPPERSSADNAIEQWVVKWGGHNRVVASAGTSVVVAKALGL